MAGTARIVAMNTRTAMTGKNQICTTKRNSRHPDREGQGGEWWRLDGRDGETIDRTKRAGAASL
jgi:hypothetical protein